MSLINRLTGYKNTTNTWRVIIHTPLTFKNISVFPIKEKKERLFFPPKEHWLAKQGEAQQNPSTINSGQRLYSAWGEWEMLDLLKHALDILNDNKIKSSLIISIRLNSTKKEERLLKPMTPFTTKAHVHANITEPEWKWTVNHCFIVTSHRKFGEEVQNNLLVSISKIQLNPES